MVLIVYFPQNIGSSRKMSYAMMIIDNPQICRKWFQSSVPWLKQINTLWLKAIQAVFWHHLESTSHCTSNRLVFFKVNGPRLNVFVVNLFNAVNYIDFDFQGIVSNNVLGYFEHLRRHMVVLAMFLVVRWQTMSPRIWPHSGHDVRLVHRPFGLHRVNSSNWGSNWYISETPAPVKRFSLLRPTRSTPCSHVYDQFIT